MSNQTIESLEKRVQELESQIEDYQKQLIHAQKMSSVGALASSITHEFNNILTTVINYAKLGLRHKEEERREKAFTKILSAGQRAAKITTGMLSYARGNEGRQEPVDLQLLVKSVIALVEKDLSMNRVNLHTHFESNPEVVLNPNQIQQVLVNLIVNARQAMPSGGRIDLAVRINPESNMAEVIVRDSGAGIPSEQLQHIFDQFYTTKEADENGQGGTGLGLSLAKEVMEAHKGRIRVESAVGKGTAFTLKFPLSTAAIEAA
ncbi:sensor histidine kinase [Gimesia fumaroli]|uniref:histidine kinase n=1 Tax=Gimesia fumaroli TaxID=2527976 RepID=A0A518IDR7_9PLAN|nr:ATP-binding protein [Gimesia fumaroli]QDV51246.1 Wide host range VirA protein [Gimesia fumaroli]